MQILGCTPVFHVSNLDNALAFYRDVLGFTLDYRYGTPPWYAGLHLGPVYLNLNACDATRTAIGCGELYLLVDDADVFYARLADSGIAFDCPIGDRDYGMRDFALRDPDGNRIGVGAGMTAFAASGPADLKSAAVLYALDLPRMAAFYAALAGLATRHAESDHVVLQSPGFQLVIVRIPAPLAATIALTDPPTRRADTPIKLAFFVDSIEAARKRVGAWGGTLNAPDSLWQFQGSAVCDGHDPEGNVFQLRERARPGHSIQA